MSASDLFPEVKSAPVPAGETDSWFTPVALFERWNAEFKFTLDAAGHEEAPVSQIIGQKNFGDVFTIEDDGLRRSWGRNRVWCNPPYSDIAPWVAKAHDEMAFGRCEAVVMLVPANRTEQPWWANWIENNRDGRRRGFDDYALETRFLSRRFKFGFPGDPSGETSGSPTFGCVLLIWRRP